MVQLYAIVGRIRLISCERVVTSAEKTMDSIIDSYLAPNVQSHEFRSCRAKTQHSERGVNASAGPASGQVDRRPPGRR